MLADRRRGHGAVLAQRCKQPPFRPCQTEFLLVDAREIAADRVGQPVEPIGQKIFKFEDRAAHAGECLDSYKVNGYECNK